MKTIIAPLGGLIGAIIGGIIWAQYIQLTGYTGGFTAIGIGFFSAIGMLLTGSHVFETESKQHWVLLSLGAAIFSILGIFIGKYLDVQWNAISGIAEQLIASEPLLSEEAARSIAETQYSGASKWELMKDRMDWFDFVWGGIAVIAAFYITFNPRVRNIIYKLSRIR